MVGVEPKNTAKTKIRKIQVLLVSSEENTRDISQY